MPTIRGEIETRPQHRRPLFWARGAAFVSVLLVGPNVLYALEPGCPGSAEPNPSVLFCDDFDDGVAISAKWSAYASNSGSFAPLAAVGVNGSTAMRAVYALGASSAGRMSIGLGGVPAFYLPGGAGETWTNIVRPESTFREIYWRQYLRLEAGWTGIPRKLSRIRVLTDPQPGDAPHPTAFQGHFWQQTNSNNGGALGALYFNNTRGVDENGNVVDRGNNTGTSSWLSQTRGSTVIFQDYPQGSGWFCIEGHVRLNEPGMQNGIEEFWIDNQLDAQRTDQDHISTFTQYGINQVIFDNYWNGGSPQENILYRDNIVVSTERIGCLEHGIPTALILDDGSSWIVDGGEAPGNPLFARNAGCGPDLAPCANPGAPTVVQIEPGGVTGTAAVYDSSAISMSGGEVVGDLAAFGDASVSVSGGTVDEHLEANDASYVELTGGAVSGFLAASEDSVVEISGGQIEQFIYAADDATIEIVGSNFAVDGVPVAYGDLAEPIGDLTGTLESGEAISNTFYQGDALGVYTGTIRLIPEPDGILNLLAGAVCLAALHRRRA